jgi:hypothetical protein
MLLYSYNYEYENHSQLHYLRHSKEIYFAVLPNEINASDIIKGLLEQYSRWETSDGSAFRCKCCCTPSYNYKVLKTMCDYIILDFFKEIYFVILPDEINACDMIKGL